MRGLFTNNVPTISWKNEKIWNKKGLLTTKLKEQGKKKKCKVKSVKQNNDQLEIVVNKIENPFSLDVAVYLCSEILPDITTVSNIIAICNAGDSHSWIW